MTSHAIRNALACFLVSVALLGACALTGCSSSGDSSDASSEQATQATATSTQADAQSDEQANCYGDDLPAVNTNA